MVSVVLVSGLLLVVIIIIFSSMSSSNGGCFSFERCGLFPSMFGGSFHLSLLLAMGACSVKKAREVGPTDPGNC